MAYDQALADRLRTALAARSGVSERKMFGGLSFLLHGHMCCGVVGSDLVVRVGPEAYADALAEPHARPMDFTGKALKGFVFVAPEGFATERDLESWVARAVAFVETLPPK